MVRRNELACRDEWSRSLWQPRDGEHANGDMPSQRPVPGPLPPALAENLHAVLNGGNALASSSQGEDVLLSEARIVSEANEPSEPPQRQFPAGHFDPRTAIFRAREAYRERVRTKAAAERQSAGVEAMIGSQPEADPARPEVSVTTTDHDQLVARELNAAAADESPVQIEVTDSWFTEPVEEGSPVVASARSAAGEAEGNAPSLDPFAKARDSDSAGQEAVRAAARNIKQTSMPAATAPLTEEAAYPGVPTELAERDALPGWYRADLPRICRTCRDYRPSAEGQRGWCANAWAFTHRRLVLEDDPAPCQSAIGDWWLPVDDVWLVAADVSSHGRATPLLDRLTAKAEMQRRRS